MASNTPNLDLLKKNPATDGNDLFDITTMLNDNWDKLDTAYSGLDTALDGVGTDVSAIKARLNTAANMPLTLSRGSQNITVDRDKPFNLTSIRGRTLLNLLGRAGNFESLTGWGSSGASMALNAANAKYGANALQITLSAATGRVSRTINTNIGRTYVVAVEAKINNASNARVDVTGQTPGNLVTSTSGYQVSYMAFTANATTHNVGVTVTGANGQIAYVDGFRVYEVSTGEYNAISTTNAEVFAAKYPYCEGIAGVKNPYAIRWADANKTQLAAILAFDTELFSSFTSDADSDVDFLSVAPDGTYIKTSVWAKLVLDGNIPWTFAQSSTGYKAVMWLDIPGAVSNSGYVTKYDKSVLTRWNTGTSSTSADSHVLDGTTSDIWITVATNDSGWGNSYNPTDNEIKAYFYGWKMYDASTSSDGSSVYNRTDGASKAWARRTNGVDASGGYADGTYTVPTTPAANFTPYEILYRRATQAVMPVPSEGALTLVKGINVLEVGSGLVLREATKPLLYPGSNDRYMINYLSGGGSINPFNLNPSSVFQVYENGRPTAFNTGITSDRVTWKNGVYVDRIDGYLPEKTYSVSYFQADRFPVAEIVGAFCDNERAILDDLIRDVGNVTRRVSVAELRKLEKESAAPWINPTCLNAWSSDGNNPAAYRRKDGTVNFTGVVLNGVASNGTVIFRLPVGFRPLQEHHFVCYAYQIADGSFGSVEIIVRVNGDVVVGLGGRSYISLANITYAVA